MENGPATRDLIRGSNPSVFSIAYDMRRKGRRFVRDLHKSLSLCGTGSGTLRVYENEDGAHSTIAAKHSCHSAWACPVCSPKIASARNKALAPQVRNLLDAGYTAHLVTLTLRHARGDDLGFLLDVIREAWKNVASGGAWNKWRKPGSLTAEYLRGIDLTWSFGNGWHPHLHIALYLPPDHSGDVEWFVQRWLSCLRALGFDAQRAAQDISTIEKPTILQEIEAAETITAYAGMTAKMPTAEAIGMAMKRSRTEGSFSPFEILAKANAGDKFFAVLWRQYVAATKGKRQVTTSRGLKLSPDEELALADVDDIAVMDGAVREEVESTPHLLADLLTAATTPKNERRCAVALVLARCRNTGWRIVTTPPDPPPD